nr:uncharacterized protein LOC119169832 [Rhipicephalus microplus]
MQGQLWEILADNEDSMAEASIWDSFLQKAFHLDSQYHRRHDVFLLAKYVVESGEIEHNGSHVPLPEFCSASETRVCHLVKLLPTLNELLYYLGAEVTEVAPGRIAARCYRSIYLELTIESGFRMVEAVMVLYCIVAKHRCIDILEVTLQPRQQYDISSLMSCVLQRMSSLRSFALKGSELTDDATTIAFKAIARLLRSQLAELSLECLDLAKPSQKACASLDAFETALSASRKLKRLKIVEVLIESEVSAEMFDFVGKVSHALTNNTSIRYLTVDGSFPAHQRGETFKRMLASSSAPTELTVLGRRPCHRLQSNFVFEALVSNKTVTTLVIDSFKIGFFDSERLLEFLGSNNTIRDVSLVYTE